MQPKQIIILDIYENGAYAVQQMRDKLVEHRQYIAAHGVDLPEIANWQWTGSTSAATSSER